MLDDRTCAHVKLRKFLFSLQNQCYYIRSVNYGSFILLHIFFQTWLNLEEHFQIRIRWSWQGRLDQLDAHDPLTSPYHVTSKKVPCSKKDTRSVWTLRFVRNEYDDWRSIFPNGPYKPVSWELLKNQVKLTTEKQTATKVGVDFRWNPQWLQSFL